MQLWKRFLTAKSLLFSIQHTGAGCCGAMLMCVGSAGLLSVPGGKPPEDWMQPRIVLLDVGMVTRLSTADQQNMVKLFQSLLGMDGQGIANAVLSFSGKLMTEGDATCSCNCHPLMWRCWSGEVIYGCELTDSVHMHRAALSTHLHMVPSQQFQSVAAAQQVRSRHVLTHAPLLPR